MQQDNLFEALQLPASSPPTAYPAWPGTDGPWSGMLIGLRTYIHDLVQALDTCTEPSRLHPHADGFDSRYFGPVHQSEIQSTLRLFW